MLTEKFLEVLKHEGVVSIVTCENNEAHVVNTWNSYIVIEGDKMLIPAAGMRKTQKNIEQNDNVKVTLGSKEVEGYRFMGTGFLVEGTARFLESGPEFDIMKQKFPFLNRVLEITVKTAKQTL
ncbi:pyridoxamine 5'-phosphate oxidase family protein [Clostridium botulinum]|uniref:pyridoxamine 5'-phosphate oxidase family protein n=1 Tax=Clostridium botulinum TaxID=1491 RepID=UPI000774924D|nr:pyridoxamine 5'-phosphate oxidase family protein [Clostridium botulinum]MBY6951389.1 pyridoxamine 5'-phosphate oxidase family protein [Clostridium botulinum]MCR1138970.1 pyridoxamine 5'-phosphate oxidase family protein [Clostridium botulinum]NEZ78771.1 pyridoxamine 5'-phosphate oxidase family protein [Clostridium botulinum]NFA16687.1 pyridoxamine 5'-phosphate oxidase family protein [Clostridium botulinum]NFA51764.1 pyridoxamine 5'-phosphate oxidase family protein [Clostridium botulinum]